MPVYHMLISTEQFYANRWDNEGAIEDYNKVMELSNNFSNDALFNRGIAKKLQGDYNGAMSDANAWINQNPNQPEGYNFRGNVHLLFGNYKKAIEDYTFAITLKPDDAQVYYNRGIANIMSYRLQNGCLDLQKSIDLGAEDVGDKFIFFCN